MSKIHPIEYYSCKELNDDGTTSITMSNTPMFYLRDGKFNQIDPRLIKCEDGYYNEENCLKTRISSSPSEGFNLSLETDSGYRINFSLDKMIYCNGNETDTIAIPQKCYNYLVNDRENVSTLIQADVFPGVVDEFKVTEGKMKRSIIIEGPLRDPKINKNCKLVLVHSLEANEDTEILSMGHETTDDFMTIDKITFVNKSKPKELIIFDPPDLMDANGLELPILYEFKFMGGNKFQLLYVIDYETLTQDHIKYPLVIDPTASINLASTSSTQFFVDSTQTVTYSTTLFGYTSTSKSQTEYSATFTMRVYGSYSNNVSRSKSGSGGSTLTGSLEITPDKTGIVIASLSRENSNCSGSATITYSNERNDFNNIARGKTYTGGTNPSYAFNKVATNYWSGSSGGYLQVDLGEITPVIGARMLWYQRPRQFSLRSSQDGTTWNIVRTFAPFHTAYHRRDIYFFGLNPVYARYFRIHLNDGLGRLADLELYEPFDIPTAAQGEKITLENSIESLRAAINKYETNPQGGHREATTWSAISRNSPIRAEHFTEIKDKIISLGRSSTWDPGDSVTASGYNSLVSELNSLQSACIVYQLGRLCQTCQSYDTTCRVCNTCQNQY